LSFSSFFLVSLEVGSVMVWERHRWQAAHWYIAFVLSLLLATVSASVTGVGTNSISLFFLFSLPGISRFLVHH